jgi:hypothetical protein
MNAMVVHFDKRVFGEDAPEFKPERGLESEERYRAMDKAMLVFDAGTRTCTGKHVSHALSIVYYSRADCLQQLSNAWMYKVVPEIVRRFTAKMAHDRP